MRHRRTVPECCGALTDAMCSLRQPIQHLGGRVKIRVAAEGQVIAASVSVPYQGGLSANKPLCDRRATVFPTRSYSLPLANKLRGPFVYASVVSHVMAATLRTAVAEPSSTVPADRLGTLFDAYHQRLYRLARRLSPTPDAAKDLVQETFLRAARSPSAIPAEPDGSAEAWLVRVLINIQRDEWRRTSARRRIDPHGTAQATCAHSSDAETVLIAKTIVWRALDQLPPRRRAILVMYELEGATIPAIAKLLGLRAVTVRWHLSRGRRELATLIDGHTPRRGRV